MTTHANTQIAETTITAAPTADDNAAAVQLATPDTSNTSDSSNDNTDNGDDARRNSSSEAASRRRQLRETEAQRDALAAKIECMQRAEISRIAATELAQADDLFTVGGNTVADLLNDAGDVDPGKVKEKTAELVRLRPGMSKHAYRIPPPRYPNFGQGSSGAGTVQSASWSAVIGK